MLLNYIAILTDSCRNSPTQSICAKTENVSAVNNGLRRETFLTIFTRTTCALELSPSQPAAALSRKLQRCPGHPLSLELRLLGHDVLLQLLHVFELLLAETLRRLVLLLLRSEDQLRRHRCHVVLARISAGKQVVVLAPLRLRVLGCLVARGNRLLEKLAGLSLYFRRRAGQG